MRERCFDIDGLRIAAREWGEPGGLPVLATHGWLDNCASFDALAPRLEGCHLIALDLAGHGQSDHRPGSAPYNIWEDVAEVFGVADQLGWERFNLLGHSRGAIINVLCAGTFPERVERLMLIEGLWPEPASIDDAPEQLARSILGTRAQLAKPMTVYPDLERAIRARAQGMFPLSWAAAKALTERGVIALSEGYQWSSDPRLLAPSAVKLTVDHLRAFVGRIGAPIQLVLGEEGVPKLFPRFREALALFPALDMTVLPGGHHLHLEAQAAEVAAHIHQFMQQPLPGRVS
ncbi:alpha/beta fold hydrolase [Marinimicrobium alkaliphilum]|uniref:alpha/beta fold hydrolase n=1 Tax=Marinimicrobium alkaliphilum TaxID=2202654 RepID=UPI000DB916C9|nr:alpha/beta hydrolase [Marinimicrobium alkaliphilum]